MQEVGAEATPTVVTYTHDLWNRLEFTAERGASTWRVRLIVESLLTHSAGLRDSRITGIEIWGAGHSHVLDFRLCLGKISR